MVRLGRLEHAKALFQQLQMTPYLMEKTPRRLSALEKAIQGIDTQWQRAASHASEQAAKGGAPPPDDASEPRKTEKRSFSSLLTFFKKRPLRQRDN